MKTFANIKESELVSKINKVVDDLPLASSLTTFSQDIRQWNNAINKPNYRRDENEKKDFIQKVKLHNDYPLVTSNKSILEKLIQNDYFEFLLPYALSNNDMTEYTNIELIGVGFYEDNQGVL